jgi:hypothetical protein
MDPDSDPDPATFVIDFREANKKIFFFKVSLVITILFEGTYASFFRDKTVGIKSFSYYFCMMIEGSGSGSLPLTNGSGSRRPKNMDQDPGGPKHRHGSDGSGSATLFFYIQVPVGNRHAYGSGSGRQFNYGSSGSTTLI